MQHITHLAIFLIPIIYMAVSARAAGGGLFNLNGAWGKLPEFAFALAFGVAAFHLLPSLVLAGASVAWSFAWMESGHGTAFHMGRRPQEAQGARKQFLSPVIDAACKRLGAPLGGRVYCWLFMGLKGALIGLPAFPYGLALAFLWPATYEVGRLLQDWKIVKDGAYCEWLSGAAAGAVIGATMLG